MSVVNIVVGWNWVKIEMGVRVCGLHGRLGLVAVEASLSLCPLLLVPPHR